MSHSVHGEVVVPKGFRRPLAKFPHLPVEDYLPFQADCVSLAHVVSLQRGYRSLRPDLFLRQRVPPVNEGFQGGDLVLFQFHFGYLIRRL